jgi:hypothetical protein
VICYPSPLTIEKTKIIYIFSGTVISTEKMSLVQGKEPRSATPKHDLKASTDE